MKVTHVIVRGFVQGVGYRKFVRDIARKMGLVGYVRNMPDNSVEILVTGEAEKVQKLLEECKKGPFLSNVKEVAASEIDSNEEFTEFAVRHDF